MGKTYRLYSNDDTVAFDAVVTLALGLGFKLWYFYLFYTKTRKVKEIKPQIGNVAAGSARIILYYSRSYSQCDKDKTIFIHSFDWICAKCNVNSLK